jgi:hypothetical protein
VPRVLAILAIFASVATADEMTGYISDAACGWNSARPAKQAKECALKCIKAGWEPVFVRDGDFTSFKIQGKSKVMKFIGDRVSVSGTLENGIVTIQRIRRADK